MSHHSLNTLGHVYMAKQAVHQRIMAADFWRDSVWMSAITSAVLLHVLLLFMSFKTAPPAQVAMQDIAIAVHLSPEPVKKADFIAQADQQGAGVLRNVHKMTSPSDRAAAVDQQEIAEQLNLQTEQDSQQRSASDQVLVTTLSWQKEARNLEREQETKAQESSSPHLAQVAMIASLEAQYAKRKQEYTHKSSIHTVDSISARADNTASYMNKFTQKVEQLGNKHYPSEARAKHLNGDVQLMVILMPNGHIRAIRLLKSSGHAESPADYWAALARPRRSGSKT